jgi:hypothetical protein
MVRMAKFRPLTNEYKLSARTLRVLWDAMVDSVRSFADEGKVRFRRRKLGNEAFINAAVWYLVDLPRAEQERVLRTYLPRLEAYLVDDVPPGGPALPDDSRVYEADPATGRPLGRSKRRRDGTA